ncbi:hypothetical protein AeRB84_014103, partial [Aphanomyces euteiches]
CPHDIKFINSEADAKNWVPRTGDPNSGSGQHGSCCEETDIWESNSISQACTSRPKTVTDQYRCLSPTECGDDATGNRSDGVCDKDGCDFNTYRLNDHTFYGPGFNFNVDSTKLVTVVIHSSRSTATWSKSSASMSKIARASTTRPSTGAALMPLCNQAKPVFGDAKGHLKRRELKAMGDAVKKGVVSTMSLWVVYTANCL